MKKTLSLFLALVMALSLCVTAFAGNATGSTVLCLTGDAADQVVDLKSGQHLSADSSTLVRLNVLDDPGAEEYTVTLDDEKLTPDHSTSQYHFYAVPAAKKSGVATLNVSSGIGTQAAEGVSVTVKVGNTKKEVTLPADGSTNASAPTDVAVPTTDPGNDMMERVSVSSSISGVDIGVSLSTDGNLGKNGLVSIEDQYTKDTYFFSNTPEEQKFVFYFTYAVDGTTYYYKMTISRPAKSGLAIGPASIMGTKLMDASPLGVSMYDNTTKLLCSGRNFGTPVAMGVYREGVSLSRTTYATTEWSEDSNGIVYVDARYIYAARFGRYWIPTTYTTGSEKAEGLLPMNVYCSSATTANNYLNAAEALKSSEHYSSISEDAKAMMEQAVAAVKKLSDNNDLNKFMDLEGNLVSGSPKISLRDYFGAPLRGANKVEKEFNTILDLTAIFTTWGTDAELAAQQFEAYQKILNMDGGIQRAIDIQSLADRDKYQEIRQAKWDLLKTTDLEGINKILTSLNLENITPAEPQVTLGDINGDGKIDIEDVSQLVLAANGYITLSDAAQKAADVNDDGKIDIEDISQMVLFTNGYITSFTN